MKSFKELEEGLYQRKREDDEYHNGPDPVKHTYKYKVSKDGGEHHERTVTTPLTRAPKHELEHLARKHLEKQGYKIHEEAELDEAVDPSEIATNPRMYNSDTVKKAYYHKKASAADKECLARHLDRHHGSKEWRKPVKEEKTCEVCKKDPCECNDDSHGFVKEGADAHYAEAEAHKNKASKALETSDMAAHHHHMSNHHEAMGRWHEEKGRHSSADREYAKAEEHHEKSLKPDHSRTVKEARMSAAVKLQRAFERQQEKSAASRKRGEELLNPPKKDEPKKVAEGMKPNHLSPGWMIRQDPKLAAIIKARKEKMKSFRQHVGTKIEDKKDTK